VVRLDAGYWGLKLIAWIHTVLGAQAVIPWNPKRQKRRDGLPPTSTAAELGKRTSIERFFGRTLVFFRLQRPPVFGWSAVETRVALTYAAVWVVAWPPPKLVGPTSSAHRAWSWPMSGRGWRCKTPSKGEHNVARRRGRRKARDLRAAFTSVMVAAPQ
jgi:transposase